jgi:hypothetical protein
MARSRSIQHTPSRNLELCDGRAEALGRFGKYAPEEEKPARKVKVKKNRVMARIRDCWERCSTRHYTIKQAYWVATLTLKCLEYSQKEIDEFLASTKGYQPPFGENYLPGIFISALVNCGKEPGYRLDLGPAGIDISHLCFRNEKNLEITGSVGIEFCDEMRSGNVVLDGTAAGIGTISGGRIVFMQDIEVYSVGYKMSGGEIIFEKGLCAQTVAHDLRGGSVAIRGNLKAQEICCQMSGGTVIIHGDLSAKRPEPRNLLGYQMSGGEVHVHGRLDGSFEWTNREFKKRMFVSGQPLLGHSK